MSDRRLIRRDRDAEAAAAAKVLEAGFQRAPAYPGEGLVSGRYDVARARLAGAVRTLLDAGWRVEAEGKLYRQAGNFTLSVTSGVDWFDLHGEIDFDGVSATLPELLRALRRGDTMVRLGDGSFGMLPEEWLKKYAPLAEMGAVEGDRLRFRRAQAGLLDALLASQPEVSVDAQFAKARDELRQFTGVRAGEGAAQRFGESCAPTRRPASAGCPSCAGSGSAGVWPMTWASARRSRCWRCWPGGRAESGRPSIVVVPKSLVWNWEQEAARFAPKLRVLAHVGPERAASATALRRRLAGVDLLVTTYGVLRKDAAFLREIEADYVILDEAQAIKNADSESAKAARLLRGDHRLALSGTPIENHLGELWSLIEFLNPGMLGTARAFARRGGREAAGTGDGGVAGARASALHLAAHQGRGRARAAAKARGDDPVRDGAGAAPSLRRAARPLPRQPARQDREGRSRQVEDPGAGGAAAPAAGRLPPRPGRQEARGARAAERWTCCWRASRRSSGRATRRWCSRSSRASSAWCATDSTRPRCRTSTWTAHTQDRQARVARFQTDDACPLFLLSLKAGGVGLNLTAADYVFILDPWWNPAVEAQAVDRAHRIGQSKRVFVYRLLCRDTVEEKVAALQETKRDLAASIIAADGSVLQKLDRETLEMLLA